MRNLSRLLYCSILLPIFFFPLSLFAAEGYLVTHFLFHYEEEEGFPPLDFLQTIEVELTPTEEGYQLPQEGDKREKIAIKELSEESTPQLYQPSALVHLIQKVVEKYNQEGYIAVFVEVDPTAISREGEDLRKEGDRALPLLISIQKVKKVGTIALGGRVPEDAPLNHPYHRPIIKHSPVAAVEGKNLVRRNLLDDYLFFLSRFPNRHVELQVTGSEEEEGINLDYLVKENKPLRLYANLSNIGTEGSGEWYKRFGLVHYQTTGKDDILALEYATTNFSHLHAAKFSYDKPFAWNSRWLWGIRAAWNAFSSSQFGSFDDEYSGRQDLEQIEVRGNIYQRKNLFVDLILSAMWRHISVNNRLINLVGKDNFCIPAVGLSLEKKAAFYKILGGLSVETNLRGVARTKQEDLVILGRTTRDMKWYIVRSYLELSRFLGGEKHELFLSASGQYVFDYRLIPQMEGVIGGAESVRGYPQALAAGDHYWKGQSEYRYHSYFKKRDIHTIFKLFLDGGETKINDNLSFESDNALMGTGIGMQLDYKESLRLKGEWAIAIKKSHTTDPVEGVNSGHNRLHLSLTLLY